MTVVGIGCGEVFEGYLLTGKALKISLLAVNDVNIDMSLTNQLDNTPVVLCLHWYKVIGKNRLLHIS